MQDSTLHRVLQRRHYCTYPGLGWPLPLHCSLRAAPSLEAGAAGGRPKTPSVPFFSPSFPYFSSGVYEASSAEGVSRRNFSSSRQPAAGRGLRGAGPSGCSPAIGDSAHRLDDLKTSKHRGLRSRGQREQGTAGHSREGTRCASLTITASRSDTCRTAGRKPGLGCK